MEREDFNFAIGLPLGPLQDLDIGLAQLADDDDPNSDPVWLCSGTMVPITQCDVKKDPGNPMISHLRVIPL
jgi:hypothetical protein